MTEKAHFLNRLMCVSVLLGEPASKKFDAKFLNEKQVRFSP